MNHSFPVLYGDIQELRPSKLAIDLYLFLTHRASYLDEEAHISWKDLNMQFGSNYSNDADFGRKARHQLREIKKSIYRDANFEFKSGRLVLKESPTPVQKLST